MTRGQHKIIMFAWESGAIYKSEQHRLRKAPVLSDMRILTSIEFDTRMNLRPSSEHMSVERFIRLFGKWLLGNPV